MLAHDIRSSRITYNSQQGLELKAIGDQTLDLTMRGQCNYPVTLRMAAHDIQRGLAD